MVEPDDAHHFLDNVGPAIDIAPPAGHRHGPVTRHADRHAVLIFDAVRVARHAKAQPFQDALLLVSRHIHTGERVALIGRVGERAQSDRRRARARRFAGGATAQPDHQIGRDRQAIVQKGGIDAAFEPAARVGGERQFLTCSGDPFGSEIGAFDEYVGGAGLRARMFAAHDAANVMHGFVIGDDGHRFVDRVGLAIERQHLLAAAPLARDEAALQGRHVIDMQRAAKVDHDVVGDVDQRADRLLADGLQAASHPFGRRAIGDAAHGAGVEGGAAVRIVGAHIRSRSRARDLLHDDGIERSQARRRQVAGDAAHAHAILPVGRDRHVDQRIVEPGPVRIDLTDRRVGREFDDAVMVVAQLQLACRTHHAVGFDAADRGLLEHHAVGWHHRAFQTEDADQARAGIGRAAHDLQGLAVAMIDGQHLQFVGLRMLVGGQHPGDLEPGELFGRIFDAVYLQADGIQRLEDGGKVRIGVEMRLEPAQGELHAPTPPLSVGTSSAEKP